MTPVCFCTRSIAFSIWREEILWPEPLQARICLSISCCNWRLSFVVKYSLVLPGLSCRIPTYISSLRLAISSLQSSHVIPYKEPLFNNATCSSFLVKAKSLSCNSLMVCRNTVSFSCAVMDKAGWLSANDTFAWYFLHISLVFSAIS